jgi:dihydroorotase
MYTYIKNGTVIDERKNILIKGDRIQTITDEDISSSLPLSTQVIDAKDKLILPGIIDVHVHFREPGGEQKADMSTESAAALRGGVTTVCDMPNNTPSIVDKQTFFSKLELAKQKMKCNFRLFLGLTNDNIPQALDFDNEYLAGLKLFLGSSTGNLLVDNADMIEYLFKNAKQKLIVAHCEDEQTILHNKLLYQGLNPLPYNIHALIRDTEVCYRSSSFAVRLAEKYNTNFHVAHLTTEKEISLFSSQDLKDKNITCEVSPNHLYFYDEDYRTYNNLIKCNPSIKTLADRTALRNALRDGYIDIVATDHAPHLLAEKQKDYFSTPSGIPSIQFSLLMMLEIAAQEGWPMRLIADKMCKNPAIRFGFKDRGEILPGYFADLVIINPNKTTLVSKDTILSKCQFSPLLGHTFTNYIETTILNGKPIYY